LSCPSCHDQLGRSHSYCPKCGNKAQDAVAQEKGTSPGQNAAYRSRHIGNDQRLRFQRRSCF
jgi:predicted amidophosphoribosyltransferase